MKIVLIGGHPKGFNIPFHVKTKSGKILRKITNELKLNPIFFDLWENQKEENSRVITNLKNKKLVNFIKNDYSLIALGRYIEKAVVNEGYKCAYLPHPASRDTKYLKILKNGLAKLK